MPRRRLPGVVLVLVSTLALLTPSGSASSPAAPPSGPVVDPDPSHTAARIVWPANRPMFSDDSPAPHVALNSTNPQPGFGHERDFVRIKMAGAPDSAYSARMGIQPRQRYTASVHFHNSGNASTSSSNTRVRLWFPSVVKGSAALEAVVGADNAQPAQVWASAVATLPGADDNVALRFIPDSAVLHIDGAADNATLGITELASGSGALVGCDKVDGVLPGGRCAGEVTVDFFTAQPDFTVDAWVSPAGRGDYRSEARVTPGEEVTVKMRYTNIGTVEQQDVILSLTQLPACTSVVPGTTYGANSVTESHWDLVDSDMTPAGLNVGNYQPDGGSVYL
jgi:hypothetical protein